MAHLTISRWGNSLALRLPKHVAEEVRLVEGSTVELRVQDGTLTILPTRQRFRLSELLANETGRSEETDWGKAAGDESW